MEKRNITIIMALLNEKVTDILQYQTVIIGYPLAASKRLCRLVTW